MIQKKKPTMPKLLKIDQDIAKVLGWTNIHQGWIHNPFRQRRIFGICPGSDIPLRLTIPHYTEHLSAWDDVEKWLISKRAYFSIEHYPELSDTPHPGEPDADVAYYCVTIRSGKESACVRHTDRLMACCLAFLQVFGGDNE